MSEKKNNKLINNSKFTEEDFSQVIRTHFYFGPKDKQLLGWLHTSKKSLIRDQSVLVCQPLGLEYMNAYRSMRYMADYFALSGFATLRFDYHGTGDSSGGNYNEDRMPDWINSISVAYKELEKITGNSKIGLFGFRMGATLACVAAINQRFDFMVLWAPIEKGRRFLKEIKTLQKMSANSRDNFNDILEAGGMVYWPETEQSISQIDLLLSKPLTERVLIIPKDDQRANTKLLDYYNSVGIHAEQMLLTGSSETLVDAHLTNVPHSSLAVIADWCRGHTKPQLKDTDRALADKMRMANNTQIVLDPRDPESVSLHGSKISESFFYFGKGNNRFAIKSEINNGFDETKPIIILVNSGSNHRVGPSALYVQLARQLASIGFLVYRIDLPGLGDSIIHGRSQENIEYACTGSHEILDALDAIEKTIVNPRFVIAGLCSGAYFSFHTAIASSKQNITEIYMINPLTFYWEQGMTSESSPTNKFGAWNWYKQAIRNPSSWKKMLSGKINFSYLVNTLCSRMMIKISIVINNFRRGSKSDNAFNGDVRINSTGHLGCDIENIINRETDIAFLFARSDPGLDLLKTLGGRKVKKAIKDNEILIDFIENADHTFSKFIARKDAIKKIISHFEDTYCKKM